MKSWKKLKDDFIDGTAIIWIPLWYLLWIAIGVGVIFGIVKLIKFIWYY